MKLALALSLGVVLVVGCAEDNPARHLPDAAADTDAPVELVVAKAGNGVGTVTSSPDGISCGDNCTATFSAHATVVLTAQPDSGSTFMGWSGACTGNATTCELTLDATTNVTATFALTKHSVTLTKSGPGGGAIHGTGVDCSGICLLQVNHGTKLTLTASPAALAVFGGWGGACTGMGPCEVTVTDDVAISASFALDNFTLFAVRSGNGSGTVTSNPAGINCGSDCNQVYTANQSVTLTATPATGSSFGGWAGGGCSGTAPCVVAVTGPKTVTASFTLNQYALSVMKTGMGTVTGTGINCGSDCSESYLFGSMVTLTATPATGYSLASWSGACSGSASTCTVSIDAAKSVTANFSLDTFALTVQKLGTGTGTVTGTGIACGSDCTETYNYDTSITLTAAAATGSTFAGWGGACSGTGSCVVTMTAARNVTATFTINTFALTVQKSGTGTGTITGTGIACGSDCTETYNYNTSVTLTAAAATGSTFTGWGGACSGTGTCTVAMTAAKNVTATFALQTFALTVTNAGGGNVTGSGISCGNDCSETYNYGTMVALTATPATNYTFTGWSGACSGTGACTVSMTQARNVTASFALQTFTLTVNIQYNDGATGTVTASGITCGTGGNDCSEAYNYGTTVTLTATSTPAERFWGWSGGGCSGTQTTCTVTMDQARFVTATFQYLIL